MQQRTLLSRGRLPTGAGWAGSDPCRRLAEASHRGTGPDEPVALRELFKSRAVAASQRDQAVTEAEVAEAGLRVAEAQVQSDMEAVAAAEAAILQAEAAVETARINLAYTRITAPISGRIGRSNVTVGALATAYQGLTFATIQQIDPIYVDATQSSASLLRLNATLQVVCSRERPQPDTGGAVS